METRGHPASRRRGRATDSGKRVIRRRPRGFRLQNVGFILFNTDLIDARHGAPETFELVHFVRIILHADHLHDDLDVDFPFMFQAREIDKIGSYALKFGAFSIHLKGFPGGAVETESDVRERRREQLFGRRFIEENAVGGQQRRDSVVLTILDSIKNFRVEQRLTEADQHHVLAGMGSAFHQRVEHRVAHIFFWLRMGFAGAHRTVEIALRGGLDDVLHR